MKTVFVLTFPIISHLNAILNVINELVQSHHIKVVTYGLQKHKQLVLKTGSEFRAYENFDEYNNDHVTANTRLEMTAPVIHNLLNLTNMNLLKIALEIDQEKPQLILFDVMSFHAKWIFKYLDTNHERFVKNQKSYLLTSSATPMTLSFSTTFAHEINIYPEDKVIEEIYEASTSAKFFSFFSITKALIRVKMLSNKFKIDYKLPKDLKTIHHEIFFNTKNCRTLVFTIPEIQPEAQLMSENVKYVGICLNENLRTTEQRLTIETPSDVKFLLDKFKPLNPTNSYSDLLSEDNRRLFFVSLGTLFNNELEPYLKIIEAIRLYNSQSGEKLYSIISTGQKCYDQLEMLISSKNLILKNDTILVPSAPQIEILKRASLFLTHAGYGSIHEALYFGVPMIAMPISADQPLNAQHLEKILKVCIRIDYKSSKSVEIKDTIEKILTNSSYHQNCLKYSKLLRNCNGAEYAADEIVNSYLQNSQN